MVNIQHFHWIYKCSSIAEYHIYSLCTELSSLLCIQSSWGYIKGMINGHQGKMLNILYMYILIYWWNRLIFGAAINWLSNHSRKTTLFISWWWLPSLIWPETLNRSRQSSLRVPACKTIKRLPLLEGIFGASDPSFGSHI
jgi:hypothetical protein